MPVGIDTQHFGYHDRGNGSGKLPDKVKLIPFNPVQCRLDYVTDMGAPAFYCMGLEGRADEGAQAPVFRLIHQQHRGVIACTPGPADDLSGKGTRVGLPGICEKRFVVQQRFYIVMPRVNKAAQLPVLEHRRLLAQNLEHGIGILTKSLIDRRETDALGQMVGVT